MRQSWLLWPLLAAAAASTGLALVQIPNRHTVASLPGDLVLGVLVPVHERPSPKQAQTRTCGTVREQYGIQRVEAAFKTIDSINADPNILPNITLGLEIRDSCWFSPIALEQSIEFIRDAMAASEQTQQQLRPTSAGGASVSGPTSADLNSSSLAVCAPLLAQQRNSYQQLASSKKVKNIVGVVGPASSTDTVQVQNLLQLFNMPQVGYSATSRDLSNKNFFKYFLRVVPADKLQAQVMIDLMLAHNWTYITVAYTEGSYGSSLMNAFRERAQEVGICFATLESVPPNADDAKFDEIIEAIQKHPNARVVVCMCEGRTVGKLFGGFKRKNITGEYLVVGSDGWADRFDVVEKHEEVALGGFSIRIHSAYVHDFDDYYFSLNPFTNQRNPWFAEFWETRFQCNLELNGPAQAASAAPGALTRQRTPAAFIRPPGSKVYNRTCTGRESLRNNHKQDAKMAFVQKSIITMALGLDSMQRAICPPGKPGLCPEMLPVNGSILLQHLMNVSFSFLNEEVYFDEQGDSPGKYEILNFQRRASSDNGAQMSATDISSKPSIASPSIEEKRKLDPLYDSYSTLRVYRPTRAANQRQLEPQSRRRRHISSSTSAAINNLPASGYSSTNGYEYVHVGSWKSTDGLSLFGRIRWRQNEPDAGLLPVEQPTYVPPKSVCSLPCAKGHAKKIQSDSVKCCWVCVACRPNEYLFDEFKCKACQKGWWPNWEQTGCQQIPIQYFDWQSLEALIAIGIAVFGLILTLATAIVFIRHNDTPVVKSSTRELSYMILFAMLLSYLNTFFLVAKPTKIGCFVTRILPGFAFAMIYGALVTKTNRIARILAGSKKKIITRRPRFMSATSQVAITWIIVLLECLIIAFMLLREPADKMLDFPSDEKVVLVCNTTTMGIIVPLGFDFFLIAMCTLYAFKTRNVPENFNEAKFIGFTMYTTLVIWIAFVVIYLSSEHKVTTLCLCISFSALFALFLLFFPRCYIIIFKPEKNNRSYFTTTKNVRCHIGYQQSATQMNPNLSNSNHIACIGNLARTGTTTTTTTNSLIDQEPASLDWSSQFAPLGTPHKQQQQQVSRQSSSRGGRNASLWSPNQRVADLASNQHRSRRSDSFAAGQAGQESFRSNSKRPAEQGRYRDSLGPLDSQRRATLGQPVTLPSAFMSRLRAIVWDRSRRRETDKAFNIQRHLRAIRQAEDLDRQTHFRRSQVQRLVQRFDNQSSQNLNDDAALDGRLISTGNPLSLSDSIEQQQQRILIAILCQLIGAKNVGKLAMAMARCRGNRAQPTDISPPGSLVVARLDLSRAGDRDLAVALLNCLGRMVQRSIECLETCGQLASDSLESIEMLICSSGSQRSTISKQQKVAALGDSARLDPYSLGPKDREDDDQDDSEHNRLDMSNDSKTCDHHNSTLSQGESASQKSRPTDMSAAGRCPDKSSNPGRLPAELGPARPTVELADTDIGEDPIKRALESIMGRPMMLADCQPEVERAARGERPCSSHGHRSRARRSNPRPPDHGRATNSAHCPCLSPTLYCCCCDHDDLLASHSKPGAASTCRYGGCSMSTPRYRSRDHSRSPAERRPKSSALNSAPLAPSHRVTLQPTTGRQTTAGEGRRDTSLEGARMTSSDAL